MDGDRELHREARPVAECAVTSHGDTCSWRIGCRPVCRCIIAWSVGLAACSAGSGRTVRGWSEV